LWGAKPPFEVSPRLNLFTDSVLSDDELRVRTKKVEQISVGYANLANAHAEVATIPDIAPGAASDFLQS
jgi:hypothetical protein